MTNNLQAPFQLPSDGSANPAFTVGTKPHVQYPFAEIHNADQATSSGTNEGLATYDPSEDGN